MIKIKMTAVLLAAVILFQGCSPLSSTNTDDAPELQTSGISVDTDAESATEGIAGYDFDNRFGMGYDRIIETDDAYYYAAGYSNYLCYYDKQSGTSDILCSRPDCMHDDKGCNGLICMIGASLNYWDGRLHFYAGAEKLEYALFSVSPDGSNKTKDTTIIDELILSGHTPQRLDYHRGMLYGWTIHEGVSDGEPILTLEIISIDTKTSELRTIFEISGKDSVSEPNLYYYRNFIYMSVGWVDVNEDSFKFYWELLRWNIDEGTLEEVYSANSDTLDPLGDRIRLYVESPDKIWFAPTDYDKAPAKVYLLENGEVREAFRFNEIGAYYLVERAAVSIHWPNGHWEIHKLDGSVIYDGHLDLSFVEKLDPTRGFTIRSMSSLMGSAEEIFVSYNLDASDGGNGAICLVRYDLTADKPTGTLLVCANRR